MHTTRLVLVDFLQFENSLLGRIAEQAIDKIVEADFYGFFMKSSLIIAVGLLVSLMDSGYTSVFARTQQSEFFEKDIAALKAAEEWCWGKSFRKFFNNTEQGATEIHVSTNGQYWISIDKTSGEFGSQIFCFFDRSKGLCCNFGLASQAELGEYDRLGADSSPTGTVTFRRGEGAGGCYAFPGSQALGFVGENTFRDIYQASVRKPATLSIDNNKFRGVICNRSGLPTVTFGFRDDGELGFCRVDCKPGDQVGGTRHQAPEICPNNRFSKLSHIFEWDTQDGVRTLRKLKSTIVAENNFNFSNEILIDEVRPIAESVGPKIEGFGITVPEKLRLYVEGNSSIIYEIQNGELVLVADANKLVAAAKSRLANRSGSSFWFYSICGAGLVAVVALLMYLRKF